MAVFLIAVVTQRKNHLRSCGFSEDEPELMSDFLAIARMEPEQALYWTNFFLLLQSVEN